MNEVYVIVKGLEIEEFFDKDIVSVQELADKIVELNLDLRIEREKNEYREEIDYEEF